MGFPEVRQGLSSQTTYYGTVLQYSCTSHIANRTMVAIVKKNLSVADILFPLIAANERRRYSMYIADTNTYLYAIFYRYIAKNRREEHRNCSLFDIIHQLKIA